MFKFRVFLPVLILSIAFCACKKTIREQQEKYVLSVLTTGRWYLENYSIDSVDNTFDFIKYEFKFYDDSRLDAITATSTQTGTWTGNPAALTMTIQFPGSDPTLQRLNYPWLFTNSHIGLVFAETTTASGKITIRLRKRI